VERVDLAQVRHAERARWRAGGEWDRAAPKVAVGELLGGGGWYARLYDWPGLWPRPGVCRYAGPDAEHYARATAGRWMRTIGGDWVKA
jgi:hypothetical protein